MKTANKGELEQKVEAVLTNLQLIELTKDSLWQGLQEFVTAYHPQMGEMNEEKAMQAAEDFYRSAARFSSDQLMREKQWSRNASQYFDILLSEETGMSDEDLALLKVPFSDICSHLHSVEAITSPLKKFGIEFFMTSQRRFSELGRFLEKYESSRVTKLSGLYNGCVKGIANVVGGRVLLADGMQWAKTILDTLFTPYESREFRELLEEREKLVVRFEETITHEARSGIARDVIAMDSLYRPVKSKSMSLTNYFKEEISQ